MEQTTPDVRSNLERVYHGRGSLVLLLEGTSQVKTRLNRIEIGMKSTGESCTACTGKRLFCFALFCRRRSIYWVRPKVSVVEAAKVRANIREIKYRRYVMRACVVSGQQRLNLLLAILLPVHVRIRVLTVDNDEPIEAMVLMVMLSGAIHGVLVRSVGRSVGRVRACFV